mmetsp:Transcript_8664/g.22407  ORF Transcript_8664/g.22407 Transcript_8664/m.22407 type:complete len:273 (+) Transcript_8664:100-918(+)
MSPGAAVVHLTKTNEITTLASLEHINAAVRRKAVTTLGQSTLVGDAEAVGAVLKCLVRDNDAEVKRASIRALQRLAPRGDPAVIAALCAKLQDTDGTVRQAAVVALESVATTRGDSATVAGVLAQLQARAPVARASAMEALGRVAARGDTYVTALVQRYLDSDCFAMRHAAIGAFAQVADIPTAIDRLQHSEKPIVRLAGMCSLGWASGAGDVEANAIVEDYLQDPDPEVRRVAAAVVEAKNRVAVRDTFSGEGFEEEAQSPGAPFQLTQPA